MRQPNGDSRLSFGKGMKTDRIPEDRADRSRSGACSNVHNGGHIKESARAFDTEPAMPTSTMLDERTTPEWVDSQGGVRTAPPFGSFKELTP